MMPPRSSAAIRYAAAACLTGLMLSAPAQAQHPQAIVDQAEADFATGRIAESVAGFDRLARLDPPSAPWMWQRGIGLYYLGRYGECADQFAAYHGVNQDDVESTVWHFACIARRESAAQARASMFSPGADRRVMRPEILEMFRGRIAPADVVAYANVVAEGAQFYAHFYAGLFHEVTGDPSSAARHMEIAASDRYREFGGFMNAVARQHWARLQNQHTAGQVTPADRAEHHGGMYESE
jgi:lipoprotein NlpI